eukprot:2226679-Prymnesium_polylepis.2
MTVLELRIFSRKSFIDSGPLQTATRRGKRHTPYEISHAQTGCSARMRGELARRSPSLLPAPPPPTPPPPPLPLAPLLSSPGALA